jgi:uncharacterized cupin superfamily protein
VRVADAELTPEALKPDRVLAGNLVISSTVLPGDDKVRYGIWQITPGQAVAVAPTGMFVVLSGRATIAVDGGPTFDVGPGGMDINAERPFPENLPGVEPGTGHRSRKGAQQQGAPARCLLRCAC